MTGESCRRHGPKIILLTVLSRFTVHVSGDVRCAETRLWSVEDLVAPWEAYEQRRGKEWRDEIKERWMTLCEQAATEQDPKKLLALVEEINELLEAKERRLGIDPKNPQISG
jgi:hypothetical protein